MSNTIIIIWVRNGMTLGTKWYGTKRFLETPNHFVQCSFVAKRIPVCNHMCPLVIDIRLYITKVEALCVHCAVS